MSSTKKIFLKRVNDAISHNKSNDEKRSLSMTYKKLNGRTVKRKISPIDFKGSNLLAYDHKRQAVRSFKMEGIKSMEKAAFWNGFEKKAGVADFLAKHKEGLGHAAEVAGLGALAVPTIQSMRGKPMSEKNKNRAELGGLGVLAAPSVAHLARKALKRV